MQFEKIRRINKGKIILGGVITLGVIGAITILPSFAKYRLTESINIVNGTINYKVPDFKVMAMFTSEDGTNYTETTTMPESGYAINEEKTYCTTDNVNQVKGKIKTENGKVTLQSLVKGDKCYLYFDRKKPSNVEELIASFNAKETPPTFTNTAKTDEGVYKVSDGMYGGYSYYWRGAATTNYVKFAGFCWRIVRINGDKTMRLIYDGTTCHANGTSTVESIAVSKQAYNSSFVQSNYVGWTYTGISQRTIGGTASNAKTQLESWYSTNIIGTNATKVAQGKFCNDRDAQSGDTWSVNGSTFYYAAYERIYTDFAPTLSCPSGDVYTLNIGLITMDEAMYAGGRGANNTSYYLYNGQNYWTMSPYYWDGDGYAYMFLMNTSGSLNYNVVTASYGLRPVINLRSDITFSSGDGTLNNPFIVAD